MNLLTIAWIGAIMLAKVAAPVVAVMLYAAAVASAAIMLTRGQHD